MTVYPTGVARAKTLKPPPEVGMLVYHSRYREWVRISKIAPSPARAVDRPDLLVVHTDRAGESPWGVTALSRWQHSSLLVPGYGDCPPIPGRLKKSLAPLEIPEGGE